jgi:hypothetical protein
MLTDEAGNPRDIKKSLVDANNIGTYRRPKAVGIRSGKLLVEFASPLKNFISLTVNQVNARKKECLSWKNELNQNRRRSRLTP